MIKCCHVALSNRSNDLDDLCGGVVVGYRTTDREVTASTTVLNR